MAASITASYRNENLQSTLSCEASFMQIAHAPIAEQPRHIVGLIWQEISIS